MDLGFKDLGLKDSFEGLSFGEGCGLGSISRRRPASCGLYNDMSCSQHSLKGLIEGIT